MGLGGICYQCQLTHMVVGNMWVLISAIIMGFLCGFIGTEKGRNGLGWFAWGFLFGIFALIAVIAVPSLKKKE